MAYGIFVMEDGAGHCAIVDDNRERALEKAAFYSEEHKVKVKVIDMVTWEEVKKEKKRK